MKDQYTKPMFFYSVAINKPKIKLRKNPFIIALKRRTDLRRNLTKRCKTYILKTIKHCWKK
jgi:hypothetical protein